MKKIKIMFYADAFNATSGYSRVGRELATRLAKDDRFDVYFQQIVDFTPAYAKDNVKVLPSYGQRGTDMHLFSIMNHHKIINPDYFIPISDIFLLVRDKLHIPPYSCKVIPYVLIDGYNIPDNSDLILPKSNKIVTASYHGQKQLKDFGWESTVIYHGVDEGFKPCSVNKKKSLREKFDIKEDDKVYLFVGRNFLRKRPLSLLEAIGEFNKKNPNNKAIFLFHMADRDSPGWNIDDFLSLMENKGYPKFSNVMFTDDHKLGKGISNEEIIELFQLSDFYISAASGEGFGMPIIEAMACGKPCILANNTTAPEFIDETRGILVENEGRAHVGYGTYNPLVDIEKLTEAIETSYNFTDEEYKQLSLNCIEWIKENIDWNKSIEQFKKIILGEKNDK